MDQMDNRDRSYGLKISKDTGNQMDIVIAQMSASLLLDFEYSINQLFAFCAIIHN